MWSGWMQDFVSGTGPATSRKAWPGSPAPLPACPSPRTSLRAHRAPIRTTSDRRAPRVTPARAAPPPTTSCRQTSFAAHASSRTAIADLIERSAGVERAACLYVGFQIGPDSSEPPANLPALRPRAPQRRFSFRRCLCHRSYRTAT